MPSCPPHAPLSPVPQAGFVQLSERQGWEGVAPGGRYFFTRNASTLVAFAVGAKYQPGNGFMMVGAHTDRCGAAGRRGGC